MPFVSLWRIASDTPDYTADDATGAGAKKSGGRWSRKGIAVIYTAESRALACLETLVHLNLLGLPLNRYLIEFQVPRRAIARAALADPAQLVGWDALPAGKVSLDWGDAWTHSKATLLAKVPSIVVPQEYNVLMNPDHPDMKHVRVIKRGKWVYDSRLGRVR
jgi:RES domain-containing protein